MKSLFSILVAGALIAGLTTCAFAEVPDSINYQGKLTKPDGPYPPDTTVSITFAIYDDPTNVTPLWEEIQPSVPAKYGIFSVLLGSVNPIHNTVFNGEVRYLGVTVGSDDEMSPRRPIVSVGYAFRSGTDGDWDFSGDDIYRVTGNVGIGTTAPDARLDVMDSTGVAAVNAKSEGGSGSKYGGEFEAVGEGTNNIAVYARGGCYGWECTPASNANIAVWGVDGSKGNVPMMPSGNWAGYFSGKVRVTDTLKVSAPIKFEFDYESPWFSITPGECEPKTHDLGGDPSKYIVYLYGKSSDGGIHQVNYGMDCARYAGVIRCYGCWWKGLTSSEITVCRAADDDDVGSSGDWYRAKVRILKNQ